MRIGFGFHFYQRFGNPGSSEAYGLERYRLPVCGYANEVLGVLITKLRLFHYRNIQELEIGLGPGTSLFSGRNGQGKTNILEAIYLLAYGKSFRSSKPKDCIQYGQPQCRVEGIIEQESLRRDLAVVINGSEKKLIVLGKTASLDGFVGNLHLLAFTHEHLNVVRGGPADRRAFIDRAMVSLFPGHVGNLTEYGRALKQRNSVLSSMRDGKIPEDGCLIDTWDEALVKPGARILFNRIRYVEKMKEKLPQGLFGTEVLKLHYLSTMNAEDDTIASFEKSFLKKLQDAREKDKRTGFTSVGAHRDDLLLYVNGKSLVDFGSAGQQRSGLLALYFSQMEIHFNVHKFYPVFLVDDAEAELDPFRLNTFLQYLSSRTQTILTSSKDFLLSSLPENTGHFEVSNGTVSLR
jgi:DNA replication and repair protein RecF